MVKISSGNSKIKISTVIWDSSKQIAPFSFLIAFIVADYYLWHVHYDPVLQSQLKSKQSRFHLSNSRIIEELHTGDKLQGQGRRQKWWHYLVQGSLDHRIRFLHHHLLFLAPVCVGWTFSVHHRWISIVCSIHKSHDKKECLWIWASVVFFWISRAQNYMETSCLLCDVG